MDKEDFIVGPENTANVPSAPPARLFYDSLENLKKFPKASEFLSFQKWPPGLQDCFDRSCSNAAYRYFLCDDSGSMSTGDGHCVTEKSADGNKHLVKCSRWTELTASLKFHADLACAAATPTQFTLLNMGAPTVLGTGGSLKDSPAYRNFIRLLDGSPNGGTPLCFHINAVVRDITFQAEALRASGQKALVVIATDGEASDGNVAEALRPLKDLPVWVIVRLCTDRSSVVSYWNNIDSEIELNMDVLDDLCGEAKEIYKLNKWLTYGEPLQRLREFGCSVKEFDLLDERKLSLEEVRKVCAAIYGGAVDSFPHPEADWPGFIAAVDARNSDVPPVWNPVTGKMDVWVNTARLTAAYNRTTPARGTNSRSTCCVVC